MTAPAPTQPAVLPALEFDAPLVNPAPLGLYAATTWSEVTGPSRFLGEGVRFRVHNYGGTDSFGVWDADWCVDPTDGQRKDGVRPDFLDPFSPITVWSYDECDLTDPSQAEVRERAQQTLRLEEQVAVEREIAERLLIDAGMPTPADTITEAVGYLESLLAATNTMGVIHASAGIAAAATQAQLVIRSGAALKTPLGHTWVFGGGYTKGLGDVLVATSPTYGWRDQVQVREAIDAEHNLFVAVAERSVVVGYEHCLGAAAVDTSTGAAGTARVG